MNISYTPHPEDTDNIILPDSLNVIVEALAENVHEVWAQSRIQQGWVYGPERNEKLKQHPGLVPYAKLDEVEKDYDRHTAISTLKLITKLGFTIVPKENL